MRRYHRAVGAALFLLTVAAACAARTTTTVGADARAHQAQAAAAAVPGRSLAPEPLLLIGDSIMIGARDFGNLNGLLESSGWIPEIIAEVGKGIPWALYQVDQRTTVPTNVVVELGTNPGPGVDGFQAEVQSLVDALTQRGAKKILWIPPEAIDPLKYADRADVIAQEAGSTLLVSSWPAQLRAHPEWFMND